MKTRVEISGLRELEAALLDLPTAWQRQVSLRALRKAAAPIVAAARARAPRGTNPAKRGSKRQRKTGESLKIGPGADSIRARAEPRSDDGTTSVSVGPDRAHFYMQFIEKGAAAAFRHRGLAFALAVGMPIGRARRLYEESRQRGLSPTRIPARPFLRPAFDAHAASAVEATAAALRTEIERVAAKHGRKSGL